MSNKIYPLIADKATNYSLDELYDTTSPKDNSVLPEVNSIVFGDNNIMYRVTARDIDTLTYTMIPIKQLTDEELAGKGGIISYNNDFFRLYYDKRTQPYRVTIASRAVAFGDSVSFYKLKLYPYEIDKARYISLYYDSAGSYISNSIPMSRIQDNVNCWTFDSCFIMELLTDNQVIALEVYNEVGVMVDVIRVYAKEATITNDYLTYIPKIINAKIDCSQMMPDKETIYLLEKQAFTSLNIFVEITYDDQSKVKYPIDNRQVFLYGEEDFIASFSGQRQNLMLKYFLSENEVLGITGTSISDRYINLPFKAIVVNNEILDVVKISVIPVWNSAAYGWVLYYLMYGVGNNFVQDVTTKVQFVNGTSYDKSDFTNSQNFVISVDLSDVDATHYALPTNYTQNVYIRLFSVSSGVKWITGDSKDAPVLYGQDSTNDRRPVICYDSSKQLHFIPSSIFGNASLIINSFYYNAAPPYDTTKQVVPTKPTHYTIRDVLTNSMLTVEYQDINEFTKGFSLKDGNSYVGSTLVMEFSVATSDGYTILYGVPVDVITGTYLG